MANPSSIDDRPAVLASTTSEQTVTLNGLLAYTVAHDGETNAGAGDTVAVYLAVGDGTTDADASEGANKLKLLAGRAARIGPGVNTLKFKAGAGGAATISVVPEVR